MSSVMGCIHDFGLTVNRSYSIQQVGMDVELASRLPEAPGGHRPSAYRRAGKLPCGVLLPRNRLYGKAPAQPGCK